MRLLYSFDGIIMAYRCVNPSSFAFNNALIVVEDDYPQMTKDRFGLCDPRLQNISTEQLDANLWEKYEL